MCVCCEMQYVWMYVVCSKRLRNNSKHKTAFSLTLCERFNMMHHCHGFHTAASCLFFLSAGRMHHSYTSVSYQSSRFNVEK